MPLTRRELLAIAGASTTMSAQTTPAWQVALDAWKGVRPRLLLDAQKLAAIRSGLNTTYGAMWNRVPNQVAIIRRQPPPAYTVAGATDNQLWQRDNGDSMIYLALAYLLSGDASYLADCKTWATASCAYPTWGTGAGLNNGLAAAHQLFGLAVVYDWLQSALDTGTLTTIRQTLATRAPAMYAAAADSKVFWSTRYIDNHTEVCIAALATTALALFDDSSAGPQALLWLDRCRTKMQQIQSLLCPDGASLEGVTYWDYGTEYSLKYWSLSDALLGEKPTALHYSQALWYRMYLTAPYNTWNFQNPVQMDLSDCARVVWEGPSPHMRRLAALNRNAQAQWYADNMAGKGVDRYLDAWLNFIWYDPSLTPLGPAGLPTLRRFDDMNIVAARSDWSGDESLVVFKSGPPAGVAAQQQLKTDTGDCGHAHPDANHFIVFANGEFLIRDDGYLDVKLSENHNTLLVNGKGQMGEGGEWFVLQPYLNAASTTRLVTVQPGSNLDYFAGEAAPAYSAGQGVRQFTRHILFLKPDALVIFDDIQLNQTSPMELRFHTENAPTAASTGVYLTQSAKGALRIELLTPDSVDSATGSDAVDDHGRKFNLSSVRFRRTAAAWRNVTAFSWAAKTPLQISLQPTAAGYTISAGSRRIAFQWNGAAPIESTAIPILRTAQPVLPAFGGNPAVGFTSNGYIEIYGDNLANQTVTWSGADFSGVNAPTSLAGVQVRVNGILAFVYFVSPHQINVNLPRDTAAGLVELQVFNNGVPSNIVPINRAVVAPAMLTTPAFLINGKQYIVALFPESTQNGPFAGQAGLIPGVPFRPVRAGDRIILYVLGAGPTSPATQPGVVAAASAKVTSSFALRIGGQMAAVEFFGIVAGSIGLYQLNAVVPNIGPGDQPVELTVGGVKDQQGLFLSGVQA